MSALLPRHGLLALLDTPETPDAAPDLRAPLVPYVPHFAVVGEAPPDPLAAEPSAPSGRRPTIASLRHHHCRWPMGEPRDPGMAYCGAARVPGLSWCAEHAERARSRQAPTGSIAASDLAQQRMRVPGR